MTQVIVFTSNNENELAEKINKFVCLPLVSLRDIKFSTTTTQNADNLYSALVIYTKHDNRYQKLFAENVSYK
ncbi:hypothetical protein ACQV2T_08345 [Facklamia sp. P13069]|uniref:hypothetical protein n=1 Tax=Facklamia sp. P13069 TaxID=3421954 RepID=UPI003D17B473